MAWGRKKRRIAVLEQRISRLIADLKQARDDHDTNGWNARTAQSIADRLITRTREAKSVRQALRETEDQLGQARASRARYRNAWQSARRRAEAYGEGILRHVEERDTYAGWLKEEQAATAYLRAKLAAAEVSP